MANSRERKRERVGREINVMNEDEKEGARILMFGVNITNRFFISNELMKRFILLVLILPTNFPPVESK